MSNRLWQRHIRPSSRHRKRSGRSGKPLREHVKLALREASVTNNWSNRTFIRSEGNRDQEMLGSSLALEPEQIIGGGGMRDDLFDDINFVAGCAIRQAIMHVDRAEGTTPYG